MTHTAGEETGERPGDHGDDGEENRQREGGFVGKEEVERQDITHHGVASRFGKEDISHIKRHKTKHEHRRTQQPVGITALEEGGGQWAKVYGLWSTVKGL